MPERIEDLDLNSSWFFPLTNRVSQVLMEVFRCLHKIRITHSKYSLQSQGQQYRRGAVSKQAF